MAGAAGGRLLVDILVEEKAEGARQWGQALTLKIFSQQPSFPMWALSPKGARTSHMCLCCLPTETTAGIIFPAAGATDVPADKTLKHIK